MGKDSSTAWHLLLCCCGAENGQIRAARAHPSLLFYNKAFQWTHRWKTKGRNLLVQILIFFLAEEHDASTLLPMTIRAYGS